MIYIIAYIILGIITGLYIHLYLGGSCKKESALMGALWPIVAYVTVYVWLEEKLKKKSSGRSL